MPNTIAPALRVALFLGIFVLPLGACSSVWQGDGTDLTISPPVRADDAAAYTACIASCSENTSLALVTRTGCLDGCDEARRSLPLAGQSFPSRKECQDALMQVELGRAGSLEAMRRWCDTKWTHLHNRKGCYRAADAFFAALAPESFCGSDTTEAALYDLTLARAVDATPPTAPDPAPTPAPVEQQPAPALPAPGPAPSPEPAPAPPAPEAMLPVTAPAAKPAPQGDPQVVRTTQPASPMAPPPYVPEQPETRPVIHDTPKYQTPPAGKSPQVRSERPARRKPVTGTPANPKPAPTLAPATAVPTPAVVAPVTPPPSLPAPTPAAVQPEAVPLKAEPLPVPAQQAAPTPTPAPTPQPAVPAQGTPPAATPPAQTPPVPLAQRPPAPGARGRLVLPIPATSQEQSGPSVLMPPVPSMLDQPYTAPAIITPQTDTPPPAGR